MFQMADVIRPNGRKANKAATVRLANRHFLYRLIQERTARPSHPKDRADSQANKLRTERLVGGTLQRVGNRLEHLFK